MTPCSDGTVVDSPRALSAGLKWKGGLKGPRSVDSG